MMGSLLALLAYPFIVEPQIALSVQSAGWSWVFAGCGLAVLACGWQALGAAAPVHVQEQPGAEASSSDEGAARALLWVLLPACAVVLFMGVTNELCLDVASLPFLWIVPLAIYLITFIVCFGSKMVEPHFFINWGRTAFFRRTP